VNLSALHWSAGGIRVKFFRPKRTEIGRPFGDAKENFRRQLDSR
jgi:hypothetical protein